MFRRLMLGEDGALYLLAVRHWERERVHATGYSVNHPYKARSACCEFAHVAILMRQNSLFSDLRCCDKHPNGKLTGEGRLFQLFLHLF